VPAKIILPLRCLFQGLQQVRVRGRPRQPPLSSQRDAYILPRTRLGRCSTIGRNGFDNHSADGTRGFKSCTDLSAEQQYRSIVLAINLFAEADERIQTSSGNCIGFNTPCCCKGEQCGTVIGRVSARPVCVSPSMQYSDESFAVAGVSVVETHIKVDDAVRPGTWLVGNQRDNDLGDFWKPARSSANAANHQSVQRRPTTAPWITVHPRGCSEPMRPVYPEPCRPRTGACGISDH